MNRQITKKIQIYLCFVNERIDKHKSIKNKKPFKIICTKGYEFEGTIFKTGDIGYNSFGRNVPDNWEKYNYENES